MRSTMPRAQPEAIGETLQYKLKWRLTSVLAVAVWACTPADDSGPKQVITPDLGQVAAACDNGVDDDGDDLVDQSDPGCDGRDDTSETNAVAPKPACGNGIDDDGDELIDHPLDTGCTDLADDDEVDPVIIAQCSNQVDDDVDGAVDFPNDPGCIDGTDDNEGDDPPPPACNNTADDDEDGLTDYPDDPGCGSEFDNDEDDDFISQPQCADGQDNDRDGQVDLSDPGCVSSADPREAQMPGDPSPVCSNGLDDDGDLIIDFPAEPGCAAAGDDDEANPDQPPACADGRDNDDDGLVDYPDEPGCAGVGDRDETDPLIRPSCSDGVDNDRDDAVDYPADRGCLSAADGTESGSCGMQYEATEIESGREYHGDTRGGRFEGNGSCGGPGAPEVAYVYRVEQRLEALIITTEHPETLLETTLYVRRACLDEGSEIACQREPADGVPANTLRVENPAQGDYYIFVDGAANGGGPFVLTVQELELAECLNRRDDDADGRVDFPFDPGCERASDRTEADPEVPPLCANDEDDDADGNVDFPIDIGCEAAADQDEVDVCGQGIRFNEFPAGEAFVLGNTANGTSNFNGSCIAGNGKESVFRYRNEINARLTFTVDHEETMINTGLYVRRNCAAAASEPLNGCSTGIAPNLRGRVRIDRAGPGDYFLFVDHTIGDGGPFKLSVEIMRLPPGCADNNDGDADGFIDGDDPGCESPEDEDEAGPVEGAPSAACDNGLDDDGDGEVDYPFDFGCGGKGDEDELDVVGLVTECTNSIDDDEDGRIDFPEDAGCSARIDNTERNPVPPSRCGDNVDQDNDGLLDYPFDPGCDAAGDPSEQDPEMARACSNLLDDDRDGLVDFPFDVGCVAAADNDEIDPNVAPACANGLDDDGDGRIDFPLEPGCRFRADADETDPNFAPQCANARDDDADGRIDFPEDVGCANAADIDEANRAGALERCRNGVDDDGDMAIDLADIGCLLARDNDETDPAIAPACANGLDDDADGLVDWPMDEGCGARGAECEQAGHGSCADVCVDLQTDVSNCGRCGRACNVDVACINGACGGLYTFEGIQQNVPEINLDGWTVCFRDTYDMNSPMNQFLQACVGEHIMLGCRRVGQPDFQLLAMGERASVFANTGDQGNAVTTHNGVNFYFSESYSMGFVAEGSVPSRNSCDTGNERPELRMCWHSGGRALNGGYRCGATSGLNGDAGWERVIFSDL